MTHPAPQVRVVDTVGAGDAFNAGLLSGLVSGLDLAPAIEIAVLCGALSTTATGGRACPTAAELARYLDPNAFNAAASKRHKLTVNQR